MTLSIGGMKSRTVSIQNS